MEITNMAELNKVQINESAQILTDSIPIGWLTLREAQKEIEELLIPDNTLLAAKVA